MPSTFKKHFPSRKLWKSLENWGSITFLLNLLVQTSNKHSWFPLSHRFFRYQNPFIWKSFPVFLNKSWDNSLTRRTWSYFIQTNLQTFRTSTCVFRFSLREFDHDDDEKPKIVATQMTCNFRFNNLTLQRKKILLLFKCEKIDFFLFIFLVLNFITWWIIQRTRSCNYNSIRPS